MWLSYPDADPGGSKLTDHDSNPEHRYNYLILQRGHKTVEVKGFPTIFAWWLNWRIRSRIRMPIREVQKHRYGSDGSGSATLLFWEDLIISYMIEVHLFLKLSSVSVRNSANDFLAGKDVRYPSEMPYCPPTCFFIFKFSGLLNSSPNFFQRFGFTAQFYSFVWGTTVGKKYS